MENAQLLAKLAGLYTNTNEQKKSKSNKPMKKEKRNDLENCKEGKGRAKNNHSQRLPLNNKAGEKILNTVADLNVYSDVFEAFKNVLTDMKVDENSRLQFLKKLKSIKRVIEMRIQDFSVGDENWDEDNWSKLSDPDLGLRRNSFSTSMQSLCSVTLKASRAEQNLDDDIFYQQFLKIMKCPFCSKPQIDEIYLVKHLYEDCIPVKNNSFAESTHLPFSEVQILPNNTFKCNVCPNSVSYDIKFYFIHVTGKRHKSNAFKLNQHKPCTKSLFCSACKILVYDTYKQLDFHINHNVHKSTSDETEIYNTFFSRKISFVYTQSKKFRCTVCPRVVKHTFSEVITHINAWIHKKQMNNWNGVPDKIYCLYCGFESTEPLSMEGHFDSVLHLTNVKKKNEFVSFKLCYYCGDKCLNLMKLYTHMAYHCDGVKAVKEDPRYAELIGKDVNSTAEHKKETVDVREMKSNDETDEHCIWVKGSFDIEKLLKLKTYFTNFGDVVSVKSHNDKLIVIYFKDREAVKNALPLRSIINADLGVEIIDRPCGDEGKSLNERGNQEIDSDEESEIDSDSDTDNSIEVDKVENMALGDSALQSLIQKFSSQKQNATDYSEIVRDCSLTLSCEKCDFVGFRACKLSLPTDSVNLFCSFESTNVLKTLRLKLLYNDESFVVQNRKLLSNSKIWEDVEIIEIPWYHLKCKHKATQKTCTIAFTEGLSQLTHMLRDCLAQNQLFSSFSLLVRFWFTVQKLSLGDSDYPLLCLIIFFLTNSKMASLSMELKEVHHKISVFAKKDSFDTDTLASREQVTVTELFKQFFKFLKDFNFNENAICLPLSFPVPKKCLESSWYKFAMDLIDTDFVSKPRLCIMDPLCRINLASNVTAKEFKSLFKAVKQTIKYYKW